MSKTVKLSILVLTAVTALALLLTDVLLYSQNSIYINDEWISTKRRFELPTTGSDEFLLTRTPLAGNRLDLGIYFGFQEMVYRQTLDLSGVTFKVKINPMSYLDLTYNRNGETYDGIRISRRRDMPSVFFKGGRNGRFLSARRFELPDLESGWLTVSVKNAQQGPQLTIADWSSELPLASKLGLGGVGFKAGFKGAWVDDIIFSTAQGVAPAPITFRNLKNWQPAMGFHLAILLLALINVSAWLYYGAHLKIQEILLRIMALVTTVIFCVGTIHLFDFYFYSRIQHQDSGITRNILELDQKTPLSFERVRVMFFAAWSELIGGEAISLEGMHRRGYIDHRISQGPIYCPPGAGQCQESMPPSKRAQFRLLFIGTSQTVGAGAKFLSETFFVRTHRILTNTLGPKVKLESINGAESGRSGEYLLNLFKSRYVTIKPNLVVINLSSNDTDTVKFKEVMRAFLQFTQDQSIPTVLMEEANTNERDLNFITVNHHSLRELGREFKVPVLRSDSYLAETTSVSTGSLWWDVVHLTSHGQEQLAQWLAPQLAPIIQKVLQRPHEAAI